eukprot:CAMPEP_0184403538 /NCGR_PEP_ID=MMETSP0007-20130409/85467_1 /TAXON_ID=97485 /ORGANISM="Prymnesium parvum, Strain Texoma1" /LENGTH=243 /DNA_ID=CAMNT_0026759647 /DNA_START=59 /DNA_END=790 /DNA_ORIENTATION=-
MGQMRDPATREDTYTAEQRGESTSRFETRLDADRAADAPGETWFAAAADGGVNVHAGPVSAARLEMPRDGDNEIDRLRKLRLAQMKADAAAKKEYLRLGHGAYAKLEDEAGFLRAVAEHPRVVCHLCRAGSLDGQMMHTRLQALCHVHLETFFCWLDIDAAPTMLAMVALDGLPALLLAHRGKVVEQLARIDRSFTVESLAYELGEHRAINFEEGIDYSRGLYPKGCAAVRDEHNSDASDESD